MKNKCLSLLQFQKKFREILDYVFALFTLKEGILKRDGNVYTQVVTNCKAKTLIPILREFSELQESTIYSDLLKPMMDLLIMEQRSIRVKHTQSEFTKGKSHINGIENFWGHTKHGLSKFKGIREFLSAFERM